jgi:hypothetical protein
MLLLLVGFIHEGSTLSTQNVTFHGVGVTIDLTFPEEAHPSESISHNVTITANVALTLQNFTIVMKAPVSSGWQEVKNQTITFLDLLENQNLTSSMRFTLPQEANGTLVCYVYVQTDQSVDYSSYTFHTTRVSELTFSEMQSLYNEMLANYTALKNDYDSLFANYSSLFANYTTLFSDHTALLAEYNAQVATYESLLNSYNTLSNDYDALNSNYRSKINEYNALQTEYKSLNSTHYNLQVDYNALQAVYNELNQTNTDLQIELGNLQKRISVSENAVNSDRIVMFIFLGTVAALVAIIIYIKRKQPEPYVVIRKETVAMKPDENP